MPCRRARRHSRRAVTELKALHNKNAAQVGFDESSEEEIKIEVTTRDITGVCEAWHLAWH